LRISSVQLHTAVRSPCAGLPRSVAIQQTTFLRLPAAPPATPGVAVVSFAVQLRTDVQVRSAVFRAWLASTCHLDKHPNPHRRSGWCATTLPDTEPLHICWVPTTNHLQSDGRGVRHSGNPSTFTSACNARGASPGAGSALPGSCGDVPGRQRREQHPRHRDRKFLLASSLSTCSERQTTGLSFGRPSAT